MAALSYKINMRDYRKALRDLPAGLRTADDVAGVVWPNYEIQ